MAGSLELDCDVILYKFVDEKVRKFIREEITLKSLKNLKFGYTIVFKNNNYISLFLTKDFLIDPYIKNNKDIAKFETIEEANKKAKYLNDKYNYKISDKNCISIFNYKYRELSPELSDLEKYLASESLYNKIYCNYTKDKENEEYKQVYFVQECVL